MLPWKPWPSELKRTRAGVEADRTRDAGGAIKALLQIDAALSLRAKGERHHFGNLRKLN